MKIHKKWIPLLTAVILALSLPVPVSAEIDPETGDPVQHAYVYEQDLAIIDTLDLDLVVKRAVDNNYNLIMLNLKALAQDSKKDDLKERYEKIPDVKASSGHLPVTAAEMAAVPGMPAITPTVAPWIIMTNTAVNAAVYGIGALAGGMDDILEVQKAQYYEAAHQLGNDSLNSLLQNDEAREGVKLQATNLYMQLLGQQKQIDFMNDYEAILEKELLRTTLLEQQGLASAEDIRSVNRAISKQKDDIKLLVNNHQLALLQLCFDIRVKYDPRVRLKEVDCLTMKPVARKNTLALLQNSYQMKISANNIDESEWQANNYYNSVTYNTYGLSYYKLSENIAWQKNQQQQMELTKKIEANYADADNAYQACLTEQRNLNDLQQDFKQMQARYEAGLISKHDLNKFSLKVEQAETSLYAAKLKLYVLTQKAKAMEKGAIL